MTHPTAPGSAEFEALLHAIRFPGDADPAEIPVSAMEEWVDNMMKGDG